MNALFLLRRLRELLLAAVLSLPALALAFLAGWAFFHWP